MTQPEGGTNFIEELGHEAKYSTEVAECEKTTWMIKQKGGNRQLRGEIDRYRSNTTGGRSLPLPV